MASKSEYASNWLSLFELFESASGLKLRINIADTLIINDGRILAWFFTSRDGVVSRASNHEVQPAAVFNKFAGAQGSNLNLNPYNYIALAHFETGISRPLKQQELQNLLQQMVGPYDTGFQWPDDQTDCPFCIQAYVPPLRDQRYITSFGAADRSVTCSTFARKFSLRYTHAFDVPSTSQNPAAAAAIAAAAAASAAAYVAEEGTLPLSAEEMLVESQLVALGLLEPRVVDPKQGPTSYTENEAGSNAAMPAPKAVKVEIQKIVQTILSFIERAHGLRIQGLVTEFVQASSDAFVLIGVHAVQWDSRSSRGRLGTFTERWADFMGGSGPAPAVQPSSKRYFEPALINSLSSEASLRSSFPTRAPSGPSGQNGWNATSGRGFPLSPFKHLDNEITTITSARPGSAPTVIMQRFQPRATSAQNGHMSARNIASASRRGAGGNAVTQDPSAASYALWAPRDMLTTDTVTGTLALEVEALKERLQRQTDVSIRAESALSQLAISSKASQTALLQQVDDLRFQLSMALGKGKDSEDEYERLRAERAETRTALSAARDELSSLKATLEQERSTLSSQVRAAQDNEAESRRVIQDLRSENDSLSAQTSALQRKLEEGNEIIDAIKAQLVDYKQMAVTLQSQLRRGKNMTAKSVSGPSVHSSINNNQSFGSPGLLVQQSTFAMEGVDDDDRPLRGSGSMNVGGNSSRSRPSSAQLITPSRAARR